MDTWSEWKTNDCRKKVRRRNKEKTEKTLLRWEDCLKTRTKGKGGRKVEGKDKIARWKKITPVGHTRIAMFVNVTHRCQHGLRKMRDSARNDILQAHVNFACTHKCEQNTTYPYTLSHFIKCRLFLQITHLIVNCNMGLGYLIIITINYND